MFFPIYSLIHYTEKIVSSNLHFQFNARVPLASFKDWKLNTKQFKFLCLHFLIHQTPLFKVGFYFKSTHLNKTDLMTTVPFKQTLGLPLKITSSVLQTDV